MLNRKYAIILLVQVLVFLLGYISSAELFFELLLIEMGFSIIVIGLLIWDLVRRKRVNAVTILISICSVAVTLLYYYIAGLASVAGV
jgi:hypothetical protein